MSDHRQRYLKASAQIGGHPLGPARLNQREQVVGVAEQTGDPALLACALLDLAWDELRVSRAAVAPAATAFARAWQIRRTQPTVVDELFRRKLRAVFPLLMIRMARRRSAPRAQLDRLADELEEFHRACGYSLRMVHYSRYNILSYDGEPESAVSEQIDKMLSEPRDALSYCECIFQLYAMTGYAKVDRWDRATEAGREMLSKSAGCENGRHAAMASNELMTCLLRLGRIEEARALGEIGYPAVRGQASLVRYVGRNLLFAMEIGDVDRGLEILRDHGRWLPPNAECVADQSTFAMWLRVLQFVGLLESVGRGHEQVVVPGDDRVSVLELRSRLEPVVVAYADREDLAAGDTALRTKLEKRRGERWPGAGPADS